jgi:hypothetical protein
MSKFKSKNPIVNAPRLGNHSTTQLLPPLVDSFLDVMVDGREYESMLNYRVNGMSAPEFRRALMEIQSATGRYIICYIANTVNLNIKANTGINATDELPFAEMVNSVPAAIREIDIVLVTPGGSGEQVVKFVDKLRPRFDSVRFIIPNYAMSAGTIWVMSGDEIIMTSSSYIGPTDPQVPNKEGRFVPAQSLNVLINDIRERNNDLAKKGLPFDWTDVQILNRIDAKDLGNAINGSAFSIELVKNFLTLYKFKSWIEHSDHRPVTDKDKDSTAQSIAEQFCNSQLWKSHARGITREIAKKECKLKILHSEEIDGLDRAIRRFWALTNWCFENSTVYKMFLSHDYALMRLDVTLLNQPKV